MNNPQKQEATRAANRFLPLAKFADYHPWPTPQGLRSAKHKAEETIRRHDRGEAVDDADLTKARDLLSCFSSVGGRILINEARFLHLLENSRLAAPR